MSRTGNDNEELPVFDDESNTNNNEEGPKMEASADPKLEDHMKRLEQLTTENNKLRRKAKAKRTKGSSSSSEEEDSSYEDDVPKKGKKG
jgi:hypothetical protein